MTRSTDSDPRAVAHETTESAPGVEPWLKISLVAFVPLVLAFYLPDEWQLLLFAAGGLLVVAGIVALVRQERGRNDDVGA